jgi:hypothetical protein
MINALHYNIDENSVLTWQEDYIHYADSDMPDADITEDYGHTLAWVNDVNNGITAEFILNTNYWTPPLAGYMMFNYVEKYSYDGTDVVKLPPLIRTYMINTENPDGEI